jgi:hypothetical protein
MKTGTQIEADDRYAYTLHTPHCARRLRPLKILYSILAKKERGYKSSHRAVLISLHLWHGFDGIITGSYGKSDLCPPLVSMLLPTYEVIIMLSNGDQCYKTGHWISTIITRHDRCVCLYNWELRRSR